MSKLANEDTRAEGTKERARNKVLMTELSNEQDGNMKRYMYIGSW